MSLGFSDWGPITLTKRPFSGSDRPVETGHPFMSTEMTNESRVSGRSALLARAF
jgi:hypothetical protein